MNANPFAGLFREPPAPKRPSPEQRARADRGNARKRESRHGWVLNPWDLTPTQCAVLNGFRDGSSHGEVAEALEISNKTLTTHLIRAKEAMDARNNIHAILIWDRHTRGAA